MFRFTIRDLLWLTVVVELGATWFWFSRSQWNGMAVPEVETRQPAEVLSEYRQLLNSLN